jgi:hypothetical protein
MPMAWSLKFCCSQGIVNFSKRCCGLNKANLKEGFHGLLSSSLFVSLAVWGHMVKTVTWPQCCHWFSDTLNLRPDEIKLVKVTRNIYCYYITQSLSGICATCFTYAFLKSMSVY